MTKHETTYRSAITSFKIIPASSEIPFLTLTHLQNSPTFSDSPDSQVLLEPSLSLHRHQLVVYVHVN